MHPHIKFRQNRALRCWVITIRPIVKMASVHYIGFLFLHTEPPAKVFWWPKDAVKIRHWCALQFLIYCNLSLFSDWLQGSPYLGPFWGTLGRLTPRWCRAWIKCTKTQPWLILRVSGPLGPDPFTGVFSTLEDKKEKDTKVRSNILPFAGNSPLNQFLWKLAHG